MKLYFVSYDLFEPGKDYPSLTRELDRLGKRIALSDWIIEISSQTAVQVLDALRTHMDRTDRLIVLELPDGLQWATYKGLPGGVGILERDRPFYF